MGKTVALKVISGGQTGVDRAALDAAIRLGLPHGGWCPAGRRAEDGRIPDRYRLNETDSSDYAVRTRFNVRDADATLVLSRNRLTGGSALTRDIAQELKRPYLHVRLDKKPSPEQVRVWIQGHVESILNVAGPRESEDPGIGETSQVFLVHLFSKRANNS